MMHDSVYNEGTANHAQKRIFTILQSWVWRTFIAQPVALPDGNPITPKRIAEFPKNTSKLTQKK